MGQGEDGGSQLGNDPLEATKPKAQADQVTLLIPEPPTFLTGQATHAHQGTLCGRLLTNALRGWAAWL